MAPPPVGTEVPGLALAVAGGDGQAAEVEAVCVGECDALLLLLGSAGAVWCGVFSLESRLT